MLRIGKGHFVTGFGPDMKAAANATSGEVISFETNDCWHGQICSELQEIESVDFTSLNPATGPVSISGAMPGDVLSVKILSIRTASTGVVNIIPGAGVLGHKVKKSATKLLPINGGFVQFGALSLKSKPMIGVIGVATAIRDGLITTGTPGRHGGNMDTKDICEGATLYLPVSQDGAMLAIGDIHAVMADGEVCVTGCEAEAEVQVQVDVIKGKHISWPVIRNEEAFMIIASAPSLDKAVELAADSAVSFLSNACGISWDEAYMLASLAVDMRISQCVDPLKTVRAVIPMSILGKNADLVEF